MKRVTAFVGSARKKHTYNTVRHFLNNLRSLGDIEYELITLSDHRLGTVEVAACPSIKARSFVP